MLCIILKHNDLSDLIGVIGIKISNITDSRVVLAHKAGAVICDIDKIKVVNLKNLSKTLEKEIYCLYRTYPCYRHLWESEIFSFPIKIENYDIEEQISNKHVTYHETKTVKILSQESLF